LWVYFEKIKKLESKLAAKQDKKSKKSKDVKKKEIIIQLKQKEYVSLYN